MFSPVLSLTIHNFSKSTGTGVNPLLTPYINDTGGGCYLKIKRPSRAGFEPNGRPTIFRSRCRTLKKCWGNGQVMYVNGRYPNHGWDVYKPSPIGHKIDITQLLLTLWKIIIETKLYSYSHISRRTNWRVDINYLRHPLVLISHRTKGGEFPADSARLF